MDILRSLRIQAQTKCPLCGAGEGWVAGQRDRQGRPLLTLLCPECGLYRTDPLPESAALREYYFERYRIEYKGVSRPKAHHVLRAALAARDRLGWLRPHLPAGGRWLEAGAGSGEFAFLMERAGLKVTALEPNRGYAEYLRDALGLDVREGFLEDLDPAAERFAGISCFHVLEHHPDPVGALRRMGELLAPGGVLAVEVPNAGFTAVHPGRRFHPAHLVHFHLDNLVGAAEAAGLMAVEARESADGGILWAVFRTAEERTGTLRRMAADVVWACEQGRSAASYYASPRVWARTLSRLAGLGAERLRALAFPGPRAYLTALKLP